MTRHCHVLLQWHLEEQAKDLILIDLGRRRSTHKLYIDLFFIPKDIIHKWAN